MESPEQRTDEICLIVFGCCVEWRQWKARIG